MSLVNQMLQELDARRSDISAGASFGQQIRAVPERRGVHPAWWVALALGVTSIGLVGYVLLRPAPVVLGTTQLPLKLDIDLNAAGSMQQSVQPATPAPPPEIAPLVQVEPMLPAVPPPAPAEQRPVPQATAVVDSPKERPAAVVPSAAEVVSAAKVLAPLPTAKVPDAPVPPVVNKQVKELTPSQRAENEYRKAMLAFQQGKRIDATAGLEQALQLDPKHSGARQALIGVLLDARQQDDAIQKASEGLAVDASQTGLAMILARLQLEKADLRAAIDTLERSLPYATDKADYLAFLAALLQRDGRHKQAVEQYLLALQKAPQNGIWWMGVGISLQAERRIPEAIESFKRAKATNSLTPELLAFVDARLSQLQQ